MEKGAAKKQVADTKKAPSSPERRHELVRRKGSTHTHLL